MGGLRFAGIVQWVALASILSNCIPGNISQGFQFLEEKILLQMKQELWDPQDQLRNWSPNDQSPCGWRGIDCNKASNAVTGVDLHNGSLKGEFPLIVCSLEHLVSLSLASNVIVGRIPRELARCKALKHLDLSQNELTGPLPDFISELSALEYLDLSGNNLSGAIPPAFGQLPNLRILNLFYNLLEGKIYSFLGNLSNLQQLNLANNPFDQGVIPSELGNLTKLVQLWLQDCRLQGPIPYSIGQLGELRHLDISKNNITGAIHPEITRLAKLEALLLYGNSLHGEIPGNIGNMSSLTMLDASANMLAGTLPQGLGNLKQLESLHLYYNQLRGEIPDNIASLAMLRDLILYNNSLTGNFPHRLGSASKLEGVDVSFNQLTGPLPPSLCQGGNLQLLVMMNNKFSGKIPEVYGDCSTLVRIRLANNKLGGVVPKGIWALPHVSLLELDGNAFQGSIPAEIGHAKNLSKLSLSNNRFSESLPPEIGNLWSIVVIAAGSNKFSGSLPVGLGHLHNLQKLDLKNNSFSGRIPSEIELCNRITELNLRGNNLSGEIPVQLGQLQSLNYLDLSCNHLNGNIPSTLGNLSLTFLNLSNNQLSGSVPNIFNHRKYKESFLDNPDLCGCTFTGMKACTSSKARQWMRMTWVLIGTFSAAVAMMVLIGVGCILTKRCPCPYQMGNEKKTEMDEWVVVSFHKLCFSKTEILDSVNENTIIASGGAGKVYRITLSNGETVAVKRLSGKANVEASGHDNGFKAEIEILGKIRHRNIVKLWGYLSGEDSNLLVYEYMPNGSLGDLLHGPKASSLGWPIRHCIALDAALGIAYLHHDCVPPILHRDIKSNNILLDCNLGARLADFGLATVLEKSGMGYEAMSAVAGSFGYIAPGTVLATQTEFSYTLKVTMKSDIYSFGVVLLELVTGRPAVDAKYGEGANIVKWVGRMLEKNDDKEDILDPRISGNYKGEMLAVLEIALLCTNSLPINRPSMKTVVELLQNAFRVENYSLLRRTSPSL